MSDWRTERWYKYQGRSIVPCQQPEDGHTGRWRLIVWNLNEIPTPDALTPHFRTLDAAKDYIRADKSSRPTTQLASAEALAQP